MDRIAGWFSWGLTGGCLDRMAGLQDLQDRGLWLSWRLTMDRITGLQDLQDRMMVLTGGLSCLKF